MKITLISLSEIINDKGYPASTIRGLMLNENFPLPVFLDDEFVGWVESDVDEWMEINMFNYQRTGCEI